MTNDEATKPWSETHPPTVNIGAPWSEEDVVDLEWGIKHKKTVDRIADFLCRTEQEVRDKARELGFGELPKVVGRRKQRSIVATECRLLNS